MKHLLIDFENVQPQNLDKMASEDTHIWLFLGVHHKMLPLSLVQSLLRFGERVHLVQLQKTGKNALDFYLSYYLGQITATDPDAQIGILSRDGGYDVLVEHILASNQAKTIMRSPDIDEVQQSNIRTPLADAVLIQTPNPPSQTSPTPHQPLAPYFQAALKALRQPNAYRPSRLHNLQLNLQKYVLHELFADKSDDERQTTLNAVINKLKTQNFISIDDDGVLTYQLSDADLLQKIQNYVLNLRPQTYAEFETAVKSRAEALTLTVGEADIQAFARHLREQNLIRQEKGKIEYAPFKTKAQPVTPSEKSACQPEQAVWQKVMTLLNPARHNRPNTVNAMCNIIESHTKSDSAQTDQLLKQLQTKKVIRIDGTKIVYLN